MIRSLAAVRLRWRILAGLALVAAIAVTGVYGYAVREWRAAGVAVADGRASDALNHLRVCLRVWPDSPAVHLRAARADRLAGDFPAAERHLNRCLAIQGGASEAAQLEFLLMRAQSGEVDEVAPALFDLVDRGHPESVPILEAVASSYIHTFQYGPAYAAVSRWVQAAPESAKPYYWRGWILERLNNPKGAAAEYAHALEHDPDLVPARLRLAELLLDEHDPQGATPHLERLLRQVPDRADVKARLGQCRYLEGRTDEARRLLTEAAGRLPDDPALLVTLAALDLAEGRPAEAERWARRVVATDPTDPEARYTLALALRAQGRAAEADAEQREHDRNKAMLNRVHALLKEEAEHGGDADRRAEIGRTFLDAGKGSLGAHWLTQALQLNPNHQAARAALAAYYERKETGERAAGSPPAPN